MPQRGGEEDNRPRTFPDLLLPDLLLKTLADTASGGEE